MRLVGEKTDFSVWKVSELILRDPLAKKDFLVRTEYGVHWVSDYMIAPERLRQGEGNGPFRGALAFVQAADRHVAGVFQ